MAYPETLADSRAIANYVSELTTDYEVDEEFIEEMFHGCCATLTLVDIASLTPGDDDHNLPDAKKQKKFNRLAEQTMPPILVEDGVIQDGHHRYRAAIARGETQIACYVIQEIAVRHEVSLDM